MLKNAVRVGSIDLQARKIRAREIATFDLVAVHQNFICLYGIEEEIGHGTHMENKL